jgi:hypothetical protein
VDATITEAVFPRDLWFRAARIIAFPGRENLRGVAGNERNGRKMVEVVDMVEIVEIVEMVEMVDGKYQLSTDCQFVKVGHDLCKRIRCSLG